MRVLFFAETPHRLAGAQRSLLAALTRIREHGIEPQVVFPGPGLVEEAYRAAGVPTRLVEAPPALLLFNKKILAMTARERLNVVARQLLPYVRRLAALVREERFDVVHFNTPRGILVGGLAAKLARRPAVLHLRGAAAGIGRGLWLAAQTMADRIILVARALEEDVAWPFRRRCCVVYNGVFPQPQRDRKAARRALATRLGVPEVDETGEVLFVSLSSLTPFKGLHHLLEAAAAVRQRGLRARWILAGGGGDTRYEAFLLERRKALGLDDILHVVGFVPDPLAVLAAADALVLPSIEHEKLTLGGGEVLDVRGTEGLPRSILEAMSLGVPVVASRVEGVVEQVEAGVTGMLVPPGDPSALADAMMRIAADPEWCRRAGERARAIVAERFSVDGAAAGLATVLRNLASR